MCDSMTRSRTVLDGAALCGTVTWVKRNVDQLWMAGERGGSG